jgi:hypothetical protein
MTTQILAAAPGYIALLFRASGNEVLAAPIVAWRVPVNPGPGHHRHAEPVTTTPLDNVDLADGDVRCGWLICLHQTPGGRFARPPSHSSYTTIRDVTHVNQFTSNLWSRR